MVSANVARNFATTDAKLFHVENDPSAFQSAYGPRCVRIAVYFVLIITPRMHASSMVEASSAYANIISVQISESPGDAYVCTLTCKTTQNYTAK